MLPKLAERARAEEWSYERFAEALLATEHSSREAHGGQGRIRAARFPAHKTLEEFDFSFQRSIKRQVIEHLGQLDFLHARENVILLGPCRARTHLLLGRFRRPPYGFQNHRQPLAYADAHSREPVASPAASQFVSESAKNSYP